MVSSAYYSPLAVRRSTALYVSFGLIFPMLYDSIFDAIHSLKLDNLRVRPPLLSASTVLRNEVKRSQSQPGYRQDLARGPI